MRKDNRNKMKQAELRYYISINVNGQHPLMRSAQGYTEYYSEALEFSDLLMPIVLLNGTVWKNWHPSSHGQPNRAIAPLLSTSYREPYFSNDCCYWYKWFVPVTGIIGVIRIVSQHVVGAFGYRHVDSVMHDHIPTNRCNTLDKRFPPWQR